MADVSIPSLRLGYFGLPGSFTHLAAQKRFPKAEMSSCPTVDFAFAQLQSGAFSHILVPIENASSGTITPTADQLMRLAKAGGGDALQVREALAMRIRLLLLAPPGRKPEDVRKIYSHPAPFDHCRDWLKIHYPQAELIPVTSTSEAARLVLHEKEAAALGGEQAVQPGVLEILETKLATQVPNQTTFYLVGAPVPRPAKPTHICLIFELPHVAGSLVAVLRELSRRDLNLTKILSRPIPGKFQEYRFMIEFQGAPIDQSVQLALAKLKKLTTFLALVGAYPVRKI